MLDFCWEEEETEKEMKWIKRVKERSKGTSIQIPSQMKGIEKISQN